MSFFNGPFRLGLMVRCCLAGVFAAGTGSLHGQGASPAETKSTAVPVQKAALSVPAPAKPARLTLCEPLDAIEEGRAGQPPLLPCSGPGSTSQNDPEITCPGKDDIVVILDHDFTTASPKAGANATSWKGFLQDLQSVAEVPCPGGALDPVRLEPAKCATIQGRKLGPCRQGDRFFPASLPGGEGNTTPAVEALRWAVETVLGSKPPTRRGIVVFGWDGVPDGDYGQNPPAIAIGEAIARARRGGMAVEIVASPQSYRYVFVIARAEFASYSRSLASRLADFWKKQTPAFHFSLSEGRFLRAGERSRVANLTASNIRMPGGQGGHWSVGSVPLLQKATGKTGSEAFSIPIFRVETESWLAKGSAPGSMPDWTAFRLAWARNPQEWAKLAPSGVRVGPPEVHSNLELKEGSSSESSRSHEPGHTVKTLQPCPAPRTPGMGSTLFQAVNAAPGRLDVMLFRSGSDDLQSISDWSAKKFPPPKSTASPSTTSAQQASTDPALIPRSSAFVRSLRETVSSPLVSAALVAPAAHLDPCLVQLESLVRNSHLWTDDGPPRKPLTELAARQECSSWAGIVNEVLQVRPRPFNPGTRTPQQPRDARVGIEVFIRSILDGARANIEISRSAREAQPCVLGTFRVTLEKSLDRSIWQNAPNRPN